MVPQLLLLLALSAPANTATLLVRRTGVSAADAAALTRQVGGRLASPAVLDFAESQRRLSTFGLGDGTTCGGKPECHAEVGRQLGVSWLVLVSVSQIAQDQSLALELFEVAKEKVHERDSVLLPQRGEVPAALLDSFAARVAAHVSPRPGDAPLTTDLTPKDLEPADGLPPVAPAGRSHVASFVLGGVALAALGVGLGLLVNGLSLRSQVTSAAPGDDGWMRSELTGAEAVKRNDAASVNFGIAGAAGAVGLALGATAVATW